MVEAVALMALTLKGSTSCTKLWHQAVSLVEESLSSVCLCWKDLVGMFLTTTMLSLSSLVKVKAAHLSAVLAAAVALVFLSTVLEAAEDVLPLEEEVAHVKAILFLMDANTTVLMKTMTVRMTMV